MKSVESFLVKSTAQQLPLWSGLERALPTEGQLVAAALALGADQIQPWSAEETAVARRAQSSAALTKTELSTLRDMIRQGLDPLGQTFCTLRSQEERRAQGATYTPVPIVDAMLNWAATQKNIDRIVDPGTGSARFLMRAGAAFPRAMLMGIETDPVAALLARANLAAVGLALRSRIILRDYRVFSEAGFNRTLYIGNPPYVRHHQISAEWKNWLFNEAAKLGYNASKLAGLHVHFFLATARNAKPGDCGAYITAAEWLDVNYGALVRALLLKDLGVQSITVIEPTAQPFPDAATTAVITTFEIRSKPTFILFQRVENLRSLDDLDNGRRVHRGRLSAESRWSYLTRAAEKPPEGFVELGELCRVHRGQVTGANDVWIAGKHSQGLPDSVLFPSVTRAREVFEAAGILADASRLRCIIDLPVDLDELDTLKRRAVEKFLKIAKQMGANRGYIASHRKAWWAVGLRAPAPILSTYMARRPPAFVLNKIDARHINIAHGLYPRTPLSEKAQQALVHFMQTNVSQHCGRTYAGGLTKFEPREMERIVVPAPDLLETKDAQ